MPILLLLTALYGAPLFAQHQSVIGNGWAGNSINTVVFRKNSVVTFGNVQYAAYYNDSAHVVLAKRTLGNDNWQVVETPYKGNIKDAHNCISIMVDGNGYLHLAWDHHANKLHYCKSDAPGSLTLTPEMPMVGTDENRVTYPEFYKLSNGDLLFLYRSGKSGNGNLVLNRYALATQKWERVQSNLIDGENTRNAYWQACVDVRDVLHLSWVWRESGNVASNHDCCYAASSDGGKTWHQSNGQAYQMPINAANAEYIAKIPQNSELINQTSMCVNENNFPYVATYWRPQGATAPQYQLIYFNGKQWQTQQITNRTLNFSLSGVGTKKVPISRPQVLLKGKTVYYLCRDAETGSKVTLFSTNNIQQNKWRSSFLTNDAVDEWEPTYDTELWRNKKQLHLFVQRNEQGDGEKSATVAATPVSILEWK